MNKNLTLLIIFVLFIKLSFATVFTSIGSGKWNKKGTWDQNAVPTNSDDVVIASGHTVSLASATTINNLTINTGGILDDGNNTYDLTVTGNFIVNGSFNGINGSSILLTGVNTTIDGVGEIANNGIWVLTNNKTINASAEISKTGGFTEISANTTITNNGIITVDQALAGDDPATSIWVNAAGSTLNLGSTITSVLNASAIGNKVKYYSALAQNIILPSGAGNPYYNLEISGDGTKSLTGNIIINGDLTISNGILNASNYTVNLRGNFSDYAFLTEATSTFILDGNTDQSVTNNLGETFYNLTINKSAGAVQLQNNVTVTNMLTMTAGNISSNASKIVLGTSSINSGTLTYSSGTVIGTIERWIPATGATVIFPVGTSTYYRPVGITFTNLTSGSLAVAFNETVPGNTGMPVTDGATILYNNYNDGYWALTANNSLASTNFDLSLTATGFSSFPDITTAHVVKRLSTGASWGVTGTHVPVSGSTAGRTTCNGITGHYTLADINNCTAPATPIIVGSASVCKNDVSSYSVTLNTGSTYIWAVTGGSVTAGAGTNLITITWGGTGMTGNVKCIETNGCGASSIVNLPVVINTLPVSSITGIDYAPESSTSNTYTVSNNTGYVYTWSISANGTITGGQGTNSASVAWGAEGPGQICVTANYGTCAAAPQFCKDVEVYHVINSIQSGKWDKATTWDCGCVPTASDNVRIRSPHSVDLKKQDETVHHLIINSGGTFTSHWGFSLTVTGDLTVNGQYIDDMGGFLFAAGTSPTNNFYGAGTLSFTSGGELMVIGGSKVVASSAALNIIAGNMDLDANLNVTNNGSFSIAGDIYGQNSNVAWFNSASSTLNIGGSLLAQGTLTANATSNLVNYNGAIAQTVKDPAAGYYNLMASGSNTKTLSANTIVYGDLTISSTLDAKAASNYNINLFGNWIDNGTFTARNGTVTIEGANNSFLEGTSNTSFYNLTINKTSNKVLLGVNKTVTNFLTLTNRPLDLNAYTLNISRSATDAVTRTSGYLISENTSNSSKVNWNIGNTTGPHIYPFGTTGGFYIPFTVDLTAGTIGNVTLSTYPTATNNTPYPVSPTTVTHVNSCLGVDNSAATVDRFWQIDKDGVSGTATITFTYASAETPAQGETNLKAQRWNSGGYWEVSVPNQVSDATANTVTVPGVQSFSPWTIATATSPLPIELKQFFAKPDKNLVNIDWILESDINNAKMIIERTLDGKTFEEVGSVRGANKIVTTSYHIEDEKPYKNMTSYYRLKQVDFNGTVKTYPCVPVKFEDLRNPLSIDVYPIPFTDHVNVEVQNSNELYVLRVFNTLGQEMVKKEFYGKTELHLDSKSNMYYMEVRDKLNNLITVKSLLSETRAN